MAYQARIPLAFQPVDPDDPTMQTGPEEVVEQFGLVPDYAPAYLISALVQSGAIVAVADPDDMPVPDDAAPAASNPEIPPPPGSFPITPPPDNEGAVEPEEPVTEKPSARDSKAAWESYAVHVGVPQGEAESMTKADLIAEVDRREASQ